MATYKQSTVPNAIQFVARVDSIRPKSAVENEALSHFNIQNVGYFLFVVESPLNFKGRTVLAFHGNDTNVLPVASREAYEQYKDEADMIYCCFPKQVTRILGDTKIQWKTLNVPLEYMTYESSNKLIITIREKRS